MSKFSVAALAGGVALAVAGTAIAATSRTAPNNSANTHVVNVALPDGSTARVEYVGSIAPKVSIEPRSMGEFGWAPMAMPSFAGFDRMIDEMNRESEAMMRQAQQIEHQPPGAATRYIASYGNMPTGATSTTIVSYSNGGRTCTRTTEMVSAGAGKAPKVTSSVTGDCDRAAPSTPAPVNRT
ncbi:MAG TPA: hypothetical protein VID20_05020 [Sphingomicrobium sp.]